MVNLKEYIKEGLFDDLDKREEVGGLNAATEDIKKEIYKWIIDNTSDKIYEDKLKFDFNTNPISVDYNGNITFKSDIQTLTDGSFQWGEVSGWFSCSRCESLTSLKGAPEKVGGFYCYYCKSLKSLEGAPKVVEWEFDCWGCLSLKSLKGAPKYVGGSFDCSRCKSLKTLEGAPKEVGGDFICHNCKSLKSLENAPKEVGWTFDCHNCKSLKSLEGAPEKTGRDFDCSWCGTKFTEEDVKKVSNVKNIIFC